MVCRLSSSSMEPPSMEQLPLVPPVVPRLDIPPLPLPLPLPFAAGADPPASPRASALEAVAPPIGRMEPPLLFSSSMESSPSPPATWSRRPSTQASPSPPLVFPQIQPPLLQLMVLPLISTPLLNQLKNLERRQLRNRKLE